MFENVAIDPTCSVFAAVTVMTLLVQDTDVMLNVAPP